MTVTLCSLSSGDVSAILLTLDILLCRANRVAREVKLVRSWSYLSCMLHEALHEAAGAFATAVSAANYTMCTSLEEWKSERARSLSPVLSRPAVEAAGWVNGVLAWLVTELADCAGGPDGEMFMGLFVLMRTEPAVIGSDVVLDACVECLLFLAVRLG
jgi:hypothetical protein